MIEQAACCRVKVEALDERYQALADQWAERLNLPLDEPNAEFVLQLSAQGLQLQQLGLYAPGPVRVDFVEGCAAHRRLFGGGSGQMIAKAMGIQKGVRPRVLDTTAGLGKDAFVLASMGCEVTLIERQLLIYALLEDGLARGLHDHEVAPTMSRMHLLKGNSIEVMRNWEGEPPQVTYLDPMFPHREKTALAKKEMRLFRSLVGDDNDAPALLEAALALATHRVVVKRPRKALYIAGPKPAHRLDGKSSRYDIYPKQALKI